MTCQFCGKPCCAPDSPAECWDSAWERSVPIETVLACLKHDRMSRETRKSLANDRKGSSVDTKTVRKGG